MANLIVLIHGGSELDVESAKWSRRTFAELDYELIDVSVTASGTDDALRRLLSERGRDIAFFMSSNFWANNITDGDSLLHTITGIPLVVLLQDHPAYFFSYLTPKLDGVTFFALGDDSVDFVNKYYPVRSRAFSNPSFIPQRSAGGAPDYEEFMGRENVLLCALNLAVDGMTIDQTWARIKALPPERRARAMRLVDAALTECITPLHEISETLSASGDPELCIEDIRPVLNFIKTWRRTHLVRAIIELPVLITSEYVPADLDRRYPEKFRTFTAAETWPLLSEYRFVVNSTPLISGYLHDRIVEGLAANAVCVTDRNAIAGRFFTDERDMLFFDYTSRDVADKLAAYIGDPEKAFELTVNAYNLQEPRTFTRTAYDEFLRGVTGLTESLPKR